MSAGPRQGEPSADKSTCGSHKAMQMKHCNAGQTASMPAAAMQNEATPDKRRPYKARQPSAKGTNTGTCTAQRNTVYSLRRNANHCKATLYNQCVTNQHCNANCRSHPAPTGNLMCLCHLCWGRCGPACRRAISDSLTTPTWICVWCWLWLRSWSWLWLRLVWWCLC